MSLEAFKRSGILHFEMLALDVNETDEHLFLEGDHGERISLRARACPVAAVEPQPFAAARPTRPPTPCPQPSLAAPIADHALFPEVVQLLQATKAAKRS